jgi:prepilin-type N-terminal cleavage/methylation domain-containing protein
MESVEPRRRDKGFTLIELLIVIVILGILSAVVVLSVSAITDRGQASACDADEKALRTAFEAAIANGVNTAAGLAEGALETAGYLNDPSTYWNYSVGGNGNVAQPGPPVVPAAPWSQTFTAQDPACS